MRIPTEPIGSIPRPEYLHEALQRFALGQLPAADLEQAFDTAVRDTIAGLEATGSPVITDGEQRKPSFATYPVHGSSQLAPDGAVIPFADGHTRQLPRLVSGPFRYSRYAYQDLDAALRHANRPMKQAVISASALSLLYPASGIEGYPRDEFLADLEREAVADLRGCLERGASAQIDFTEARLSLKLDSSGGLLRSFLDLNNRVLGHFDAAQRARIGVHTCPGGDCDSTHSADVDYALLLPELLQLEAGAFFVQLSSEPDRVRVLESLARWASPQKRIFVGVTDPIDPRVESAELVCERVLEAARHLPPEAMGTTDDCGFSPFGDDLSTSRETAFAKIAARVEGTRRAEAVLAGQTAER